jgi:RNA polymerase sigma factor (sigma-70 family)
VELENYNFLLVHLVNDFIKRRGLKSADRNAFLNEARVAAWKAIGDYKEEKLVKITTYISTCVNNHLSNVNKELSKNNQRAKEAKDASPEDPYHTRRSGKTVEDLEFVMTMRAVLTPHQFNLFEMRFIQDCSLVEIQRAFDMSPREVEKCLTEIIKKYLQMEEDLKQHVTKRQLQSRWLEKETEQRPALLVKNLED